MINLIELIKILKDETATNALLSNAIPGVEFDLIDIYLKGRLSIDSEARLLNSEEIPGKLEIELDGEQYINLFPLNMTKDLVTEFGQLNGGKLSIIEIANRILNYRINDA